MNKKPTAPMVIVADTREQRPYTFETINSDAPFVVESTALPTGDYSLVYDPAEPFTSRVVIERKSLQDFIGSITGDRDRFARECARMSAYGSANLIIEASLEMLADPNHYIDHETRTSPNSILGTLYAWTQRYHIHPWFCGDRTTAERVCFGLLRAWHRDRTEGTR